MHIAIPISFPQSTKHDPKSSLSINISHYITFLSWCMYLSSLQTLNLFFLPISLSICLSTFIYLFISIPISYLICIYHFICQTICLISPPPPPPRLYMYNLSPIPNKDVSCFLFLKISIVSFALEKQTIVPKLNF